MARKALARRSVCGEGPVSAARAAGAAAAALLREPAVVFAFELRADFAELCLPLLALDGVFVPCLPACGFAPT